MLEVIIEKNISSSDKFLDEPYDKFKKINKKNRKEWLKTQPKWFKKIMDSKDNKLGRPKSEFLNF